MQYSAEAEIRARIARRGKVTFAEFAEVALYHPRGGYYTSPAGPGASGDYFTSPGAHPGFGALITVQLARMWQVLGQPSPFYAVEMGAGPGLLAREVLDYAPLIDDALASALQYIAIDRHADPDSWRGGQEALHRITAAGVPLRGVVGCFLSNELLDSFPVHRFLVRDGLVREVYVTLEGDRFVEVLDEPSTPLLQQRLDSLGVPLPEGFGGEVNLAVGPWARGVAVALARGFVITIDYGYEAQELYSPRRARGTLQTYYQHTQGASPYQRIGRQDITAHVDFSLVMAEGETAGLRPLALLTQAEFLRRLGSEQMLEAVRADQRLRPAERQANIMGLLELVKPDGLGGFRVLVQEKGTGIGDARQLAPDEALLGRVRESPVPLLGREHVPLMAGRYPHLEWQPPEELWPFGGQDTPR